MDSRHQSSRRAIDRVDPLRSAVWRAYDDQAHGRITWHRGIRPRQRAGPRHQPAGRGHQYALVEAVEAVGDAVHVVGDPHLAGRWAEGATGPGRALATAGVLLGLSMVLLWPLPLPATIGVVLAWLLASGVILRLPASGIGTLRTSVNQILSSLENAPRYDLRVRMSDRHTRHAMGGSDLHLPEEPERLLLVAQLRILLGIPFQADAMPDMIQCVEVFHPLVVE